MINEQLLPALVELYLQPEEILINHHFTRKLHRESQVYSYYIHLIIEDSNGIWLRRDVLLGTCPRNFPK